MATPGELTPARLTALQEKYPWFETLHVASALHDAANGQSQAPSFAQAALVTGNELWLQVLLDEAAARTEMIEETGSLQTEAPKPEPFDIEQASSELLPEPAASTPSIEAHLAVQPYEPVEPHAGVIAETAEEPAPEIQPVTDDPPEEPQPVTIPEPDTAASAETDVAITGMIQNEAVPEPAPVETAAETPAPLPELDTEQAASVPEYVSAETLTHTDIIVPETAVHAEYQPDELRPVAAGPVAEAAEKTEAPVVELPLEPYHTIDYFAAVGVKHQQEEAPKDRLSRQLKSFTGWLKSLKKLPGGNPEEGISEAENEKVERLASNSVKKTEVLTETMADVLAGQGRIDEAIEILKKLSLQDSAKSAYFAARIAHLKLK